jgi:hypothetical protein
LAKRGSKWVGKIRQTATAAKRQKGRYGNANAKRNAAGRYAKKKTNY